MLEPAGWCSSEPAVYPQPATAVPTKAPSCSMDESVSDVGRVRRRINDYSGAMQYLQSSLRMKRTIHGAQAVHPGW